MNNQTCHAQISALLDEELQLLATLEQQLQQEYALVTANDVEGLEQAGKVRQQTVGSLLRIDDERRQLCRLFGHAPDQTGLAALLAWCDPTGSLAAAHARCAEQARLCREQNDRNGALVTARLRRVSGMLNQLQGNAPSAYGPRGTQAPATRPAGFMLSASA